jgi:hypothetical protein
MSRRERRAKTSPRTADDTSAFVWVSTSKRSIGSLTSLAACLILAGSQGLVHDSFQRIKSKTLFSTSLDVEEELHVPVCPRKPGVADPSNFYAELG